MLKKSTLLAMSVGALLAFAAPAAQATGPLITKQDGQIPTYINATTTNTIVHTSAGTIECTTETLTIHLKENAKTTATGNGTGSAEGTPKQIPPLHSGHCGISTGAVVEITNVNVSDFHLTKHGAETTGTAAFSFTYDLRSATGAGLIAECTFGGTVPVKKTGAASINFLGEIVKTAGGAFCPATGTVTGDFTLEEDKFGGIDLIIH